jgi:hypothetical protein
VRAREVGGLAVNHVGCRCLKVKQGEWRDNGFEVECDRWRPGVKSHDGRCLEVKQGNGESEPVKWGGFIDQGWE